MNVENVLKLPKKPIEKNNPKVSKCLILELTEIEKHRPKRKEDRLFTISVIK